MLIIYKNYITDNNQDDLQIVDDINKQKNSRKRKKNKENWKKNKAVFYRDLKEKNIHLRKEKLFQQSLLTNINCVSSIAVCNVLQM